MKIENGTCQSCGVTESLLVFTPPTFESNKNTVFKEFLVCNQCIVEILSRLKGGDFMPFSNEQLADLLSKDEKLYKGLYLFLNDYIISEEVEIQVIDSPSQVMEILENKLVGQKDLKEKLALALFRHSCSLQEEKVSKNNILIAGPTGTGKTESLRILSKELNIPYVTVDATRLSPAAHKGFNVEDLLKQLVQQTDGNIQAAEKGIIFIDEIDKLASSNSRNFEVAQRIQFELLRLIEGGLFSVPGDMPGVKGFQIDTTNILFVLGGAFANIRKKRTLISLGSEGQKQQKEVETPLQPQDIINYGVAPELVGRMHLLATTKQLTKKEMMDILINKEDNLIDEYKHIFKMKNIRCSFSKPFLNSIVEEALSFNIGARALKGVFENKMQKLLLNIENIQTNSIVISDKFIKNIDKTTKNKTEKGSMVA